MTMTSAVEHPANHVGGEHIRKAPPLHIEDGDEEDEVKTNDEDETNSEETDMDEEKKEEEEEEEDFDWQQEDNSQQPTHNGYREQPEELTFGEEELAIEEDDEEEDGETFEDEEAPEEELALNEGGQQILEGLVQAAAKKLEEETAAEKGDDEGVEGVVGDTVAEAAAGAAEEREASPTVALDSQSKLPLDLNLTGPVTNGLDNAFIAEMFTVMFDQLQRDVQRINERQQSLRQLFQRHYGYQLEDEDLVGDDGRSNALETVNRFSGRMKDNAPARPDGTATVKQEYDSGLTEFFGQADDVIHGARKRPAADAPPAVKKNKLRRVESNVGTSRGTAEALGLPSSMNNSLSESFLEALSVKKKPSSSRPVAEISADSKPPPSCSWVTRAFEAEAFADCKGERGLYTQKLMRQLFGEPRSDQQWGQQSPAKRDWLVDAILSRFPSDDPRAKQNTRKYCWTTMYRMSNGRANGTKPATVVEEDEPIVEGAADETNNEERQPSTGVEDSLESLDGLDDEGKVDEVVDLDQDGESIDDDSSQSGGGVRQGYLVEEAVEQAIFVDAEGSCSAYASRLANVLFSEEPEQPLANMPEKKMKWLTQMVNERFPCPNGKARTKQTHLWHKVIRPRRLKTLQRIDKIKEAANKLRRSGVHMTTSGTPLSVRFVSAGLELEAFLNTFDESGYARRLCQWLWPRELVPPRTAPGVKLSPSDVARKQFLKTALDERYPIVKSEAQGRFERIVQLIHKCVGKKG